MNEVIDFKLNGKPVSLPVDSDRMLLWVLRTDLGLTGTVTVQRLNKHNRKQPRLSPE